MNDNLYVFALQVKRLEKASDGRRNIGKNNLIILREREREREKNRERQKERERKREKEREKERERGKERELSQSSSAVKFTPPNFVRICHPKKAMKASHSHMLFETQIIILIFLGINFQTG